MKSIKLFFTAILLMIPVLTYSQVSINGSLYPSYYFNVNDKTSTFNVEGFTSVNYFEDHVSAFVEVNTDVTDVRLYQATLRLNFNIQNSVLGTVYAGKFENPWQGRYGNNMYNLNRSNTMDLLPNTFVGVGLGAMTLNANADVMIGNVNDSVKTLFAQANISKGNVSGGVFINGNIGSKFEHPYFGGRLEFNNSRIDVLVESILRTDEVLSLRQNTRGVVIYNIPKTNFGLFGEYINHNFGGKTEVGVTGAVTYKIENLNLSAGWNGYVNWMGNRPTHLAFISAGYMF